MLKWLRSLFAKKPMTPKEAASLLNLARSNDEEKTRQVLAKTPIRKPTQVLAHVLDASSPKVTKQPPRRGAPPPTNLATVMADEARNQIRRRGTAKPDAPAPVLANVLKAAEDPKGTRKPTAPTGPAPAPLARLTQEQQARLQRRVGPPPTLEPAALPIMEWSRNQQMAATGGRPPPPRPDHSRLHAALSKEDAILRAMAARSAAKEVREKKNPETALDLIKANKALAVKTKPG